MKRVYPRLIQGGMGVGVSGWELAKAVSQLGQLGTVSITGIWVVTARKLQLGDEGGHIRRALSNYPNQETAQRIINRYYVPAGELKDNAFRNIPMLTYPLSRDLTELIAAACFAEVWLAKEGHNGLIAVNSLEKIQVGHLPSLYGCMLAGVDCVLMGAGIPLQIYEAIDRLSQHEPATYRLSVEGASSDSVFEVHMNPRELLPLDHPVSINRPDFFPIVSTHVLAAMFNRRGVRRADGFIIEAHSAGGHNAPPRASKELSETGEPIYTDKDVADLSKMDPEYPFWLAGSRAHPSALKEALALGAHGVQVGSIFALCKESNMREELKQRVINSALQGNVSVYTNPHGSPSGFPFKEMHMEGTLSDADIYSSRQRICDIGAFRNMYCKPDGKIGYRCSAEPVDDFVKKGGTTDVADGTRCLCNALCATVGLGQTRPTQNNFEEPPLVTVGDDLSFVADITDGDIYTAKQAVDYLLSP